MMDLIAVGLWVLAGTAGIRLAKKARTRGLGWHGLAYTAACLFTAACHLIHYIGGRP